MLNMSRFPRFFTPRAMSRGRNDGLIRAPIITENDGFFIGTTGFTVILRATGRIWAIFNQIFALTFATGVYCSLDNRN